MITGQFAVADDRRGNYHLLDTKHSFLDRKHCFCSFGFMEVSASAIIIRFAGNNTSHKINTIRSLHGWQERSRVLLLLTTIIFRPLYTGGA